jgi:2-dehydropantoate 2-reductase
MRFAVVGAGGLGGYFGGRLAQAGETVTFIVRGNTLNALRARGLRIDSVQGGFELPQVQATDNPRDVAPVDCVIMTVKAYDLEGAARIVQPLVGSHTVVLPLLNGVDIAERIGAIVGLEHMLGGLAYIFSTIVEPGVIRHNSPFARIQLGELPGGISERAGAVEAAFQRAGVEAVQVPDIRAALWTKFLFLAATSGMCAVTRSPMGEVRGNPESRERFIACMREVESVARHLGIALKEGIVEETIQFADGVPPDLRPSMLNDLEKGLPLELEALNGTVVRLARPANIPVPVNIYIYDSLKRYTDGRR